MPRVFRPMRTAGRRRHGGAPPADMTSPTQFLNARGPFDIIGDVHGCHAELVALLEKLGYVPGSGTATPPAGRMAVFLGDLCDRGPDIVRTLRLVMGMVRTGRALCVLGNHDEKLMRRLRGNPVQVNHGLERSVAELEGETPEFRASLLEFLQSLPHHLLLDGGRLVVAHAGLPEALHGRDVPAARAFCLHGASTGRPDADGLPIRLDWAADYQGAAAVLHGHVPVATAAWRNSTLDLDLGCVFGGALAACRWPEREIVSVPSSLPPDASAFRPLHRA